MQQSEAGLLADESFNRTVAAVEKRLPLLDRLPRVRVKAWLVKLNESTSNITWKRNRNLYARLLLEQLRAGVLEVPFHGLPPQGALPTLPAFLTYRFLPPPGSERTASGAEAGPSDNNNNNIITACPPMLSDAPPEPIWITPGRYASQHLHQQQQRSLSAGRTRSQQPRSPPHPLGSRDLHGSGSVAAPGTPPGALPAGSPPVLAGTWGGAWETSPAAAAATACAAAAAAAAARRYNATRAWPGSVPAPAHGLRSSSSSSGGGGKQTPSAQQQLYGSLAAGGFEPGTSGRPRSPVEAFVEATAALNACYPEGFDGPGSSQRLEARLHYAEAKLFEQELELQRLHAATAAAKRQLKAATRACLDDLLTRYSTTSTSGSAGGGTGASGSSTWMSPWARAGAEAAGAAGADTAAAAAGPSTQHLPSAVEEALEPLYDLVSTVDRVFAGVTRWPGPGYTQQWPPSPGRTKPGAQQQQQQTQRQSQRLAASSSRRRSAGQQKGHTTAAAAAGARGRTGGDQGAGWDHHQQISGQYDDMEEGEAEESGQLLAAEPSQDSIISGGPDRGDLGAGLTPEASSEAVGAAAGPLQHGLGPLAAAQLADTEVEMAEEMDLMLQTFRSMLVTCNEQQEASYRVLASHMEEALASSSSRKAARKLSSAAAAAVQPLRQLLTMYRRHCVKLQDQAYASAATAAAAAAAAGDAGHDTGSLLAETSQPDVTSPPGEGHHPHAQQQTAGKRGSKQQQGGEEGAAGVTRSQQMHAQLQQLLTDFASHIAVVEQQLQVYADRALESAAAAAKARSSGDATTTTSSSKKQGTGGSSGSVGPALCEGAQDWTAKMMGVLEAFAESLQQLQERADVLHWRQQQERLHDMQQRQQRVRSLERSNSVNATVGSCYSRTSIGVREPLSAAEAAAARATSAAAAARAAAGEYSDDEPEQEEIPPPPLWQLIADSQPKGYKDGSQFGNIVDYILSNSPRTGAAGAGQAPGAANTSVAPPRGAADDAKNAKAAAVALLGGGSTQSTVPTSPRPHTASPLGMGVGSVSMGRSASGPVGPAAAAPPVGSTNNAMADRVASLSQQASKLLDKSSTLLGGSGITLGGAVGAPAGGGGGGGGGGGPATGLSSTLGRLTAQGTGTSMAGGMSSGGALLGGAKAGGTGGSGVPLSAAMASAWGSTSKGPLAGPTGGSNSSSLLRKSGEGLLGGGLGTGMSMGGALLGGGGGGTSGLSMGGAALAGATGGSSSSLLKPNNFLGTSFGGASNTSGGFSSAGRLW